MAKVTELTLYKQNEIAGKYSISLEELVSGYMEECKRVGYLQASNFERGIILYIGVALNSTPEHIPLTDAEVGALIDEWERQKKEA